MPHACDPSSPEAEAGVGSCKPFTSGQAIATNKEIDHGGPHLKYETERGDKSLFKINK